MLLSLALIFIIGITLGWIFERIKLPRLIGMLIAGVIIGPYALNLLDPTILTISADIRQIALIIILIKAGLSLDINDLKKVGRPAILMSFIPACFEIVAVFVFAPLILGISYTEALVMGSVLGAVSPAVVVPKMVALLEEGYGKERSIPQLILASASLDDVFVIVLFTSFLNLEQGMGITPWALAQIPISIISGLSLGLLLGFVLSFIFLKIHLRDSLKVIIVLAISCLLVAIENALKNSISLSSLLAVMGMSLMIRIRKVDVAKKLSEKFSKLWVGAEILLFVLVGAEVNINYATKAGLGVIGVIFIALAIRSIGVFICFIGTSLNKKERLFCIISYLPKATVQAAIGSIPLSIGLGCGQIVLTVAVVSIIITAPLGALLMDLTYKKLLSNPFTEQTNIVS